MPLLKRKGAKSSLERRVVADITRIGRISQTNVIENEGYEISKSRTELTNVQSKEDPQPSNGRSTTSEKNIDKGMAEDAKQEGNKNVAEVNLLVATIITSITFAAAITMPGGYSSSDGMTILRRKTNFKLFLWCNSLAFGFSAASIFIHFFMHSLQNSLQSLSILLC